MTHVIRDSGDYHCVAKNDHPPIIVKTIRLNVMCKSGALWTKRELMRLFQVGPEVRAVRAELLVEVGRTARLGCEVRGYPAPETGWYKDDRGDYLTYDNITYTNIHEKLNVCSRKIQ